MSSTKTCKLFCVPFDPSKCLEPDVCSSYIHAEWNTYFKLLKGDKRFDQKLKRYKAKLEQLGPFAYVSSFDLSWQNVSIHLVLFRWKMSPLIQITLLQSGS